MFRYTARKLVHTAFVALGVDLMEQARYSLDPGKRRALYAEATRIIHEEKPWLELFQEVIVVSEMTLAP